MQPCRVPHWQGSISCPLTSSPQRLKRQLKDKRIGREQVEQLARYIWPSVCCTCLFRCQVCAVLSAFQSHIRTPIKREALALTWRQTCEASFAAGGCAKSLRHGVIEPETIVFHEATIRGTPGCSVQHERAAGIVNAHGSVGLIKCVPATMKCFSERYTWLVRHGGEDNYGVMARNAECGPNSSTSPVGGGGARVCVCGGGAHMLPCNSGCVQRWLTTTHCQQLKPVQSFLAKAGTTCSSSRLETGSEEQEWWSVGEKVLGTTGSSWRPHSMATRYSHLGDAVLVRWPKMEHLSA